MKHPGSEVAVSAKEVPVLQNSEKYVLDQVLTYVGVLIHTKEEAIQRLFIAFKKQAQAVEVAILDLEHQGIVCQ